MLCVECLSIIVKAGYLKLNLTSVGRASRGVRSEDWFISGACAYLSNIRSNNLFNSQLFSAYNKT